MPERQPGRRRVFFALWPGEAASGALHAAARAACKDCGGRLMRRETLHMTLAFLGEVDPARLAAAQAVASGLPSVAPFDLAIDRLGCWRHNHIVWAGCEAPPALGALADGLAEGLRAAGFRLDDRPFAPHVTLLRDARCPEALPAPEKPVAWPVGEFVLVESRLSPKGADYAVLARYPLASDRMPAT